METAERSGSTNAPQGISETEIFLIMAEVEITNRGEDVCSPVKIL